VPSFEPDASLWEPWIPAEVAVAMRAAAVEWAVAGGWAIDLYLRETTREHEDIEIVVAPEDFAAVTRAIDLEWLDVGDGCAWPLGDSPTALHQTWGRDKTTHRWRLDVFREPREAGDWIFRRDRRIRRALATAVDHDPTGIPYLVPELVLLYKAREPREKDEADFGLATGTFTHEQARWLGDALRVIEPDHRWIKRLDELSG
jgi:hypothetical protein